MLLLAGCSPTTGLRSPSSIYTTKFAGSQPAQETVDRCATDGQAVFWNSGGTVGGGERWLAAGTAYEKFMTQAGFNPQ